MVGQALAHKFETAEHRHQQIVKIVGDAAGELPDGVHLLRLKQGLACLFEFLLGVPALGNVPCDLGVSKSLPAVVANGIDDDVRPEAAAVLADAPTFFFKSTLPLRGPKWPLRPPPLSAFPRGGMPGVGG